MKPTNDSSGMVRATVATNGKGSVHLHAAGQLGNDIQIQIIFK